MLPLAASSRQLGVELGRDHGELEHRHPAAGAPLRSATSPPPISSTGLLSSRQKMGQNGQWGLRIRRFGSGWQWWWSRSPRDRALSLGVVCMPIAEAHEEGADGVA